LMNEEGKISALPRLEQMLIWHHKHQNPKTAGFDSFSSPSYKQRLESLAGAVHNFHLHLYLGEKYRFEDKIIPWVEKFLVLDNLSACESIDFVELAVYTISNSSEPQRMVNALLLHAEALLHSQRGDGGWAENGNGRTTSAAGFSDSHVSSCSYATWFKLASLGMIAITLLGDDRRNWGFRKTLGMGYAPVAFPELPGSVKVSPVTSRDKWMIDMENLPQKIKSNLIGWGARILK
jgi:hypothetical protein